MSILRLLSILLFALLLAWRAQADTPLRLEPDIKVGQRFTLEFTRSRQSEIPERANRQGSSTSEIEIRIKAANRDGYTLEWRLLDVAPFLPSLPEPANPALLKKLRMLSQGTRYLLRFDSAGNFLELANFAAVRPKLLQMVDAIAALDKRLDALTLSRLRQRLSERKSMQALLVRDALVYFNPMLRGEASLSEHREYRSHLANPFGGEPLQATGTLDFAAAGSGRIQVVMAQKIDPAALPGMIENVLSRMGRPLPEAEMVRVRREMESFDIQERIEYLVPAGRGWPESARLTRTVSTAKGREITRIEIVRQTVRGR